MNMQNMGMFMTNDKVALPHKEVSQSSSTPLIRGALMVISFSYLGIVPSYGCSCVGGLSAAQYFQSANVMFYGIAITSATSNEDVIDSRIFEFSVTESSKGNVNHSIYVRTGAGGGDCGYQFSIGQPYAVYASQKGVRLYTNICSGTHEIMDIHNKYMKQHEAELAAATYIKKNCGGSGHAGQIISWEVTTASIENGNWILGLKHHCRAPDTLGDGSTIEGEFGSDAESIEINAQTGEFIRMVVADVVPTSSLHKKQL